MLAGVSYNADTTHVLVIPVDYQQLRLALPNQGTQIHPPFI